MTIFLAKRQSVFGGFREPFESLKMQSEIRFETCGDKSDEFSGPLEVSHIFRELRV